MQFKRIDLSWELIRQPLGALILDHAAINVQ